MQKTCSNELIIAWLLVDIRVWVWYLTWRFIECFSMRECVPINQLSERVSEHRFDVNWNFNPLRWLHHGKEWQRMHCIRKCDVMWVCTTCIHNKLNLLNSQAINRNGSHPMNVDWLSMLDMMIGHSTHFRHNVFKSYANHTHQTTKKTRKHVVVFTQSANGDVLDKMRGVFHLNLCILYILPINCLSWFMTHEAATRWNVQCRIWS